MKIPKLPKKEEAKIKKLSIREAMAAGWQLFRTKFWTCFWMLILAGFVVTVPQFLIWFFCAYLHQGPLLNLVLLILYPLAIVTVVIVTLGTYNVMLRLLDDQDVTVVHLVSKSGKLITFLIAGVLFGLALSLGLFFFFIPGVMIMVAFQFYPYFIVDQDTGPIQALKASRAITAGARWKLFFLALILGFIQGITLGLFWWTLIVPFLVMMYVFLTLACAYRLLLINTPAEKLPFEFNYEPSLHAEPATGETTAADDINSIQSIADTQEAADTQRIFGTEEPEKLSIADRAEMMDIGIANKVENQDKGENPDKGERLDIATKELVPEKKEPVNDESQEAKKDIG